MGLISPPPFFTIYCNVQNTHIICFFPRSCSPVNVRRELFLTLLKNKLFVQTFSPKHVLHLFNISATQEEKICGSKKHVFQDGITKFNRETKSLDPGYLLHPFPLLPPPPVFMDGEGDQRRQGDLLQQAFGDQLEVGTEGRTSLLCP